MAGAGGADSPVNASGPGDGPVVQRRDAVRNEQRVLDAARVVLARVGPHAGIEEIAAEAGVGVGTIYRRFGSKDALVDAVAGRVATDVERAAARALSAPAGEGLPEYLDSVGRSLSAARKYAELWLDRQTDSVTRDRIRSAVATLVERAIAHGVVDAQTQAEDILVLTRALAAVIQHSPDDAQWRRFLSVHLRGMGAAAAPADGTPPGLGG